MENGNNGNTHMQAAGDQRKSQKGKEHEIPGSPGAQVCNRIL